MNQYYVYILASRKNGTLYIGVTNNVIKRVYEHKHDVIEGFTKNTEFIVLFMMNHTQKSLKPYSEKRE